MLALRYLYVLALAVWLGGALVLGVLAEDVLITTPVRFQDIGYLCGAVLILTLSVMALLGPRPSGFAVRLAIAAAMLAAAAGRSLAGNIAGGLVLLYWEARDHGR